MDHYFSDRIAEATIKAKIEMCHEFGLSVSEIAGKLDISKEEVSKVIEKLETENLQKQN